MANLLTPQESLMLPLLPIYPKIEEEYNLCVRTNEPATPIVDRIQIQMQPDRFALMVRHTTNHHWCVYVPISLVDWNRIEKAVRATAGEQVTYAGGSTSVIVWMQRTQSGRLTQPTVLNQKEGADHWVGFHTWNERHNGELLSVEDVKGKLYGFENLVWRFKQGDLDIAQYTGL